jgi:hypothetical protein
MPLFFEASVNLSFLLKPEFVLDPFRQPRRRVNGPGSLRQAHRTSEIAAMPGHQSQIEGANASIDIAFTGRVNFAKHTFSFIPQFQFHKQGPLYGLKRFASGCFNATASTVVGHIGTGPRSVYPPGASSLRR